MSEIFPNVDDVEIGGGHWAGCHYGCRNCGGSPPDSKGNLRATFKIASVGNTRNGAAFILIENIHTGEKFKIPWGGFRDRLVGIIFAGEVARRGEGSDFNLKEWILS